MKSLKRQITTLYCSGAQTDMVKVKESEEMITGDQVRVMTHLGAGAVDRNRSPEGSRLLSVDPGDSTGVRITAIY